jgi:myosin-crossreactive antigen
LENVKDNVRESQGKEENDIDEDEEITGMNKDDYEDLKDNLFNKVPIYYDFLKTMLAKMGYKRPATLHDIIGIRDGLQKK